MKIVEYAITLCQCEMLDKIRGEYFEKYLLNYPDDIEEEIQELENAEKKLVDKIDEYRQENKQLLNRIAADLNIVDGKINVIEFVNVFENATIELTKKEVNIDNYIKDAYKRFDTAWKLCVKYLDIKAVKKYNTEDILKM